MTLFLLRRSCLIALLSVFVAGFAGAQKHTVDIYKVRVITTEGNRFGGTLRAVDNSFLYLSGERNWRTDNGQIPLSLIRKVVLRRINQKSIQVSGAIAGGLAVGYIANQSLQRNQTRGPVTYGLTLTFAAAGGAAAGLLLGSAVGTVNRRIIRPLYLAEPELTLFRQLEPFSLMYQQDVLDRLPKTFDKR